jgi:hypothetical protein
MSHEIIKKQGNQIRPGVRELLSKHSEYDPDQINAKRERFLVLLEKKYGYTNEKAVDELERLLRQFYRMNKSLGIHNHILPNFKNPSVVSRKNSEE